MYLDGVSGVPNFLLKLWGCCLFLASAIFSAPLHKNRTHRLILYALTLCCIIYSVVIVVMVVLTNGKLEQMPNSISTSYAAGYWFLSTTSQIPHKTQIQTQNPTNQIHHALFSKGKTYQKRFHNYFSHSCIQHSPNIPFLYM